MSKPIAGAEAYSADGTIVATIAKGGSVCVRPVDSSAGPGHCAKVPAPVGQVVLSPDGRTAAIMEDYPATYIGGMWLMSAITGDLRAVPGSDGVCGAERAMADTRTAGPAAAPESKPSYVGPVFTDDDTVVVTNSHSSCIVSVGVKEMTPKVLFTAGSVGPSSAALGGVLVADGTTIVTILGSHGGPEVVVVDTRKGGHRVMALRPSEVGLSDSGSVAVGLLAVSPDGRYALAVLMDQAAFKNVALVRIDLRTAQLTHYDWPQANDIASGAVFSPDGTQIIALQGLQNDHSALLTAATDDPHLRRIAEFNVGAPPETGLYWGPGDIITPSATVSPGTILDLAPIRLTH